METEQLTINKATIDEIDTIMRWRMTVLHDVFTIPSDADVSELEKSNREYYLSQIPNGGHIACFARLGGEIIGCGGVCLYHEMPSPDNASGRCAYLMNIYVQPQYRKHGYGRLVTEWLIGHAKEQGITKIYLEASTAGKLMYKHLGFSEMEGYLKL
jgi:GNAT superfamily N-acetyltransferase